MSNILTLITYEILFIVLYYGASLYVRENYQKEENKKKKPLCSVIEIVAVTLGELALIRAWWWMEKPGFDDLIFTTVSVMVMGTCVFTITDLREHIVPNKLILLLLLAYIIIFGTYAVANMDKVIKYIPNIVMGLLFSLLIFGFGYVLAKGSIGAGDVKLTLLMGLYLTGEHVVAAVFYGCVACAVFSIVQLLRKKITKKDFIPFVPFLYLGLLIRLMLG